MREKDGDRAIARHWRVGVSPQSLVDAVLGEAKVMRSDARSPELRAFLRKTKRWQFSAAADYIIRRNAFHDSMNPPITKALYVDNVCPGGAYYDVYGVCWTLCKDKDGLSWRNVPLDHMRMAVEFPLENLTEVPMAIVSLAVATKRAFTCPLPKVANIRRRFPVVLVGLGESRFGPDEDGLSQCEGVPPGVALCFSRSDQEDNGRLCWCSGSDNPGKMKGIFGLTLWGDFCVVSLESIGFQKEHIIPV